MDNFWRNYTTGGKKAITKTCLILILNQLDHCLSL